MGVAAADMAVEVEVVGMAVGVEVVGMAVGAAGAVGLPRFTAEAADGMVEAVGIMVAWPTWAMAGVAMHRALTVGLTRIHLVTP
jgi:hypothetical protein